MGIAENDDLQGGVCSGCSEHNIAEVFIAEREAMDEEDTVLFFKFIGQTADQLIVRLVQHSSRELALVWIDDAELAVLSNERLHSRERFVCRSDPLGFF